ncbi:helix-turn-helix domain-containing protein [Criibacterium bergeronii]|uniref:XRE family transcriptional regulator n=1 Tax=Criibacterium bergeronii TaxID=1871336 RepID=A0A371IJV0_9FIRM|nr:helix-turn-helix domain-containing protein [Criibacterium bergeronii]RDY20743.1 XRE family transcriptional regulator [Criibacterium bergeronii]
MTNSKKLKDSIKKSGYKMGYLANKLGLSRQALSNKINNITDFTVKEMLTLSQILALNDEERKEIFLTYR